MHSSGARANAYPDDVKRNIKPDASRFCLLFFALLLQPVYCQRPPVNSGTEDTAVDPVTRLEHYRKESRYPPDSRPAQNIAFNLKEVPLIDGDAATDAEISAFAGEAMESGSLVIKFKVKIKKAGRYSFKSIVASENAKPLAFCTTTKDLAIGEHTMSFRLFGLIAREASQATGRTSTEPLGPFVLPGIVGERLPNDQDLQDFAEGKIKRPPQGSLTPFNREYRTQKYALNLFSEREWDSAEKQNRIRELEAEIKQYKTMQP